jgi:hypothetical protein
MPTLALIPGGELQDVGEYLLCDPGLPRHVLTNDMLNSLVLRHLREQGVDLPKGTIWLWVGRGPDGDEPSGPHLILVPPQSDNS